MALQFISGNSISDRTAVIYETICTQACSHPDKMYLFLVPEQATLQVQRELAAVHPDHVLGNIDVLSFGRLAHRLLNEQAGKKAVLLDDTGKSMILRRIAGKEKSQLEVFGRNLNQSGFIQELKSVISEFSAYRITNEVLEGVLPSLERRPALQKKLRDIEKVYTSFYKELGEEYLTAEELLNVLARLVPQSEKLHESIVILDGFTGFTPLQYQVLEEILQCAKHVVCAVTEDEKGGREELFAMSREMKTKLSALAKAHQVPCSEKNHRYVTRQRDAADELKHLEKQLYCVPAAAWNKKTDALHIICAKNPTEELGFVLRKILELVRDGFSYRDIAVVAGDLETYRDEMTRLFDHAGIPYFIDQKKGLKNHPLIQFVKKALAVLEEQMSYDSVMAFLRNPYVVNKESVLSVISDSPNQDNSDQRELDQGSFAPNSFRQRNLSTDNSYQGISCEDLDRLDNYLLAGGIERISRWKHPWAMPYDNTDEKGLERFNILREQIYNWFVPLRTVWENPDTTVREAMTALFSFMQQFGIAYKLKAQQTAFHDAGELYLESEYEQVYPKVLALFDQIVELMGDETLETRVLSDILDSGFEELQVGFIPAAVDRLVVGDLMRTRLEHIRVLFVIGCNDGLLPKRAERGGILSDYDREILKGAGMELALAAREEVFCQQYYLYLLLTKPSEKLYVSFSETAADGKALRPAHVKNVITKLFPKCPVEAAENAYPGLQGLMQKEDGFLLLVNGLRSYLDKGQETWWQELYSCYVQDEAFAERLQLMRESLFYSYKTERLDKQIAKKLFGGDQELSISRLEKYAACAYAHFLTYGLKLKERRQFELGAADYGSLFHASISHFFELLEKHHLNWREIDDAKRNHLVEESVAKAMEEYQTTVFDSSARNKSMADRIRRMTDRTLWALGHQWEHGSYEKTWHEMDFGKARGNAVTLPVEAGLELSLRGRIDRVDFAEEDGSLYVKVIDYKSGGTKLDLGKVYYGLQLQLVLYLEAAMAMAAKKNPGKELIPAGIYYYNMKDPIVSGFGMTKEEIESKQQKELRMNGLTSTEKASLSLIDDEGGNVVSGLEYKKDGSLSSRALVANADQMHEIGRFARKKALNLARSIYGGKIDAYPYEYKKMNPCEYCEYGNICGFDLQFEGCHYRRLSEMDQDEVWKEMAREESRDENSEKNRDATSEKQQNEQQKTKQRNRIDDEKGERDDG